MCTCVGGTATVATGSGATLCETASAEDCSACNAGYSISAPAAAGLQTCDGCAVFMFECGFQHLCPSLLALWVL